ncbi:hypothetical protein [Rhodoplanes roseus]|uniref:Uncharacterized protein n=1 Tax=Rhodoplanes roseus TaxID=29409 RepID=A0A327L2Q2_9BRAD|nr:hypothetical protein [Rhodoplanes roseus]RAI44093.1 hypothetical protein CH341_10930 [Rhodoplanes roseus]
MKVDTMPNTDSVTAELARLRAFTGTLLVEVKLLRLHLTLARDRLRALAEASDAAFARCMAMLRRWAETSRKANFNPAQPRVPAGNIGAGQWMDSGSFRIAPAPNDPSAGSNATPGSDLNPRAQYAGLTRKLRDRADGHHYVPRAVFEKHKFPPETAEVFENAKSGKLHVVGNRFDLEHRNIIPP